MNDRINLALVIRGDELDEQRISNFLGVEPTSFTKKGYRQTSLGPRPTKSTWRLYAGDRNLNLGVVELWQNIKDKVGHKIFNLRSISPEDEINIEIILYSSSYNVDVHIPGDLLDFAKNTNSEIEFYYYDA